MSVKVDELATSDERLVLFVNMPDTLSIAFYALGKKKPWRFSQLNRATGQALHESYALQRELEQRMRLISKLHHWRTVAVTDRWYKNTGRLARSNVKDWNE